LKSVKRVGITMYPPAYITSLLIHQVGKKWGASYVPTSVALYEECVTTGSAVVTPIRNKTSKRL